MVAWAQACAWAAHTCTISMCSSPRGARAQGGMGHGRGHGRMSASMCMSGSHLHDLHVQQPKEAAAEAKTHGRADLGLKPQRRIVELQLVQSLPQILRAHTSTRAYAKTEVVQEGRGQRVRMPGRGTAVGKAGSAGTSKEPVVFHEPRWCSDHDMLIQLELPQHLH